MRTSSIVLFKNLLSVAVCVGLLGFVPKANSSFTLSNDNMSWNPMGIVYVPRHSVASRPLMVQSTNQLQITRYAVTATARNVITTGADRTIVPSAVSIQTSAPLASLAKYTVANSSVKPPSNGLTSASSGPLILYTDLTSGPNSGGEHNNGAYLTIFGTHFGATQGPSAVMINGRAVAQYLFWSNTKIGVQVGHASSGPIVVSVGGLLSNSDNTFAVRSGKIYFIGPSVDNSAPGSCSSMTSTNSYSKPWGMTNYASTKESNYSYSKMRTPYTYYQCMSPGDILVFLNGVSYPYFDGRGWHSSLTLDNSSTTLSKFMTIMARPGAKATLGGEGWAQVGIRNTGASIYTVYSGLTLIGSGPNGGGLNADSYDRFVGNIIKCPDCSGPAGALTGGTGNEALGNLIYDISTNTSKLPDGSNKTYHAAYFQGNNFEFAWNHIYKTMAYNGFQINEDSSSGFYNFSIHDNDIADVNGSGINLSTIDPSSGYIKIFNNTIHHVGLNIASDGGGGDPHSCLAVKGYGRAAAVGTVEVYNNTMYDCNSYLNLNAGSSSSCAVLVFANQLNVTTHLVNNIVYQPAYAGTTRQNVYICGGGAIGTISGSNNLWYSERTPRSTSPATQYGTIDNPQFVSSTDYHLQSGSPAIGAGIAFGGLTRDFDGMPRPNPPAIGAYEYSQSSSAATSSLPGKTEALNPAATFSARKRVVFLSTALASLMLIGACLSWQQF